MPLVVITGPPSTGKSRRATELAELLSQRPRGRVEKTRTLAGRGVLDKDHVKGDGRFNSFRKNKEVKEIKKEEVDKDSKDLNGLESGVAELKIEASSAAPSSAPTEEKPKDTWTVNIVNEESIKADRQSAYKNATTEKLFRASLQSSTERLLSKNSITVLDSINGIKGVRYQLYCSAKSIPTQYCVVYIACSKEVSVEWNEKREERYTKEQMDDLWTRFEEPDGRNRWDSPLFTILPDDDLTKPDASGVSIIDRIAAVMTGDPLKQNMSTMRNPVSESTYIQDLDRALMNVCESIVAHQSDFGAHCPPLSIPGCTAKLTIPPRIVGMAELRRLKKGWEALNKLRRVEETGRAVESFVEYLNGIW